MREQKVIALVEVLLAVIFWGASFVATKIALRDVQPITIVWVRFAMGVIILGLAVLSRKQMVRPARNELGYFTLLGFLGITFHQLLQSNGLITAQATDSAWIVATTPVFIALLSWFFLKEILGWTRVIGIALAAVGVLLVVTKGNLDTIAVGKFGAPGDILVLISAVNWAVFTALSRRGLRGHPPALMMFYVMLIGWVLLSFLFLPTTGVQDVSHLTPSGWLAVGFLGIFCSGFAYIFWYDGLNLIPASQVGVFLYVEPLVTLMVAAVAIGENITLVTGLGGAVILAGVWLVNRPTSQERTKVQTVAPNET